MSADALSEFLSTSAEPLQYGTLRLLDLKKERFAVTRHQQRDTAKRPNRAHADGLEHKIHYLMAVENVTPIRSKTIPVHRKGAIGIELVRRVGIRVEMEDRRWLVGNSQLTPPYQARKVVVFF